MESAVLNREEAARYLGVSISTLNRLVRDYQIPVVQYSSGQTARLHFRPEDLDGLIEQCTRTPEDVIRARAQRIVNR